MRKLWFILAILMTSYGFGALLPNEIQFEHISDFSGGLNTTYPSHKIPTNYSPYMRNVFIDNGVIERSPGYISFGSTNTLNKVTGIFPYVQESGETVFLVTDSSQTFQTVNFSTYIFVSSGSNTGTLLNWIQVRNKMWGFNGVDNVITWDGSAKKVLNGNSGTPNVPKFKYGVFFQDRVWGFGIPNGASDLYFSSVISTDAVILAPDDSRAWPPINGLYVGRGDGTIGTALFVYQGQLRAAKENSLYTLYGDNETSFALRKEETKIGVISNDSVVDMDGDVHYLSKDGIYRNLERISDLISPDIQNFNTSVGNVSNVSWDSEGDFLTGYYSASTVSASGFVKTLQNGIYINHMHGNGTYDDDIAAVSGSTITLDIGDSIAFSPVISTETIPDNFIGYPASDNGALSASLTGAYRMWMKIENNSSADITWQTTIRNEGTGVANTTDLTLGITNGFASKPFFDSSVNLSSMTFTKEQLVTSSFTIRFKYVSSSKAAEKLTIFFATQTGASSIYLVPVSTGQFISSIATVTTKNFWTTFDPLVNTNGGSANFFIRSANSIANVQTQPWTSILPGGAINELVTNNYIQWATTMASVSTTTPVSIDNVKISYRQGQTTDGRAFAIDWKNRYWLAVTTTTNNTKRVIYVKSKTTNTSPNAWMPIEGIDISCFAKSGDFLYGGSATTGKVYRLDYGTNYDGSPITSIYDTPDMITGDNYFDKNLQSFLIDGKKYTGGSMEFKYSLNQRDYTDKSYTFDGTGRYSKLLEGVRDNGSYKTIKMRFENSQLDVPFTLYNFSVLYTPSRVLTSK